MIRQTFLTKTEEKVIDKKLNNEKLTKQDSYYLSTSIRPKLRQAKGLIDRNILKRIEYNPKALSIEKKIVSLILKGIKGINAIVVYGSAIQTNYSEYNDIDLLIVTKNKILENKWKKIELLNCLENKAKKGGLNLDIQLLDIRTFKEIYPSNISLIYQLKDKKIIYGKLKIPNKIKIPKIMLKMKMDWSELIPNPSGEDIYGCIRNTLLIKTILDGKIDNFYLFNLLVGQLGKNMLIKLKENNLSQTEKKMLIDYLNQINLDISEKLEKAKWEKIEM